uniref:ANF_receptor domain-containing protein n=1 Tax=Rhabditophanes sp. KR3021 TaxID=114890 RepID=A0AC35U3V4_9BILA
MMKVKPIFDEALLDVYYTTQKLPKNAFELIYVDTESNDAIGPQRVIEQYCLKRVDAIFGIPYAYGLAPIARITPYWNKGVPVFTTSVKVEQFSNKQQFPLLTRLTETNALLGKLFVQMFNKYFKYDRVFYYFNEFEDPSTSIGKSDCYFTLNPIKNALSAMEKPVEFESMVFHEHSKDQAYLDEKHGQFLKRASFYARVIILCASPNTVREIMLAAHDLGMATSGEYVFINIDVSTGSHAEKPWLRSNDTTAENNEKAKKAYKALKTISLRRSDLREYQNFETRVKNRAESNYNYKAVTGKEYEMNNFISAFYDAVLLYAIALNETLKAGLDPRDGKVITSKMWNRKFKGITGEVSIDMNGDRYSDYSLLDLDEKQDKFVEVAYYSGSDNKLVKVSDFHWIGGKPPNDDPICGFV